MSEETPDHKHRGHPLGMNPGSVRALLALSVVWTFCAVVVLLTLAVIDKKISIEVMAAAAGVVGTLATSVIGYYFLERKNKTTAGK